MWGQQSKNKIESKNINVKNIIENKTKNKSQYTFTVNDNNLLNNNESLKPLPWRRKKFESNYNCGTNRQNKKITGYLHKQVKYDCKVENNRCKSKLQLNDNGELILYTGNNYQNIGWRRKYTAGPQNNEKKASVGKYKRNYLLQGETLSPGEFIGSPSGTCFLTLEKKRSWNHYNYYQLVIKYKKYSCPSYLSKDKNKLYEVENIDRTDLNKIAFITEGGKKKLYPDSMTSLSNEYFNLGNYYSYSKNIQTSYATKDNCKKKCNENQNCYGFAHNKKGNWCYLKGKDMYPVDPNRKYTSDFDLYLRKKGVNKEYCPKDIVNIDLKTFNSIEKANDITSDYTCNFTNKLGELQKTKLEADNKANENANKIIGNEGMTNINDLYNNINEYNELYSNYINKNNNNIGDLNNIKSDISVINNNNPSIEGQLEDFKKNYYSEKYYYILLSIISIIFIILSIKIANS